jgi:hypothetical protein
VEAVGWAAAVVEVVGWAAAVVEGGEVPAIPRGTPPLPPPPPAVETGPLAASGGADSSLAGEPEGELWTGAVVEEAGDTAAALWTTRPGALLPPLPSG